VKGVVEGLERASLSVRPMRSHKIVLCKRWGCGPCGRRENTCLHYIASLDAPYDSFNVMKAVGRLILNDVSSYT
jgi:hypothetical protein